MKRDLENLNLRDTFKATPEKCHDALLAAARSAKEEAPVKRITARTVLITACIILATMAIAIAATRTLGWADFFEIVYGDKNAVTEEVQALMDSTEEQTFTIGPVSFTVQSLYANELEAMASTLITTADGSLALFCGEDDPDCPMDSNGENSEALAKKLGLDPRITWTEAARQLNCPLYQASARLHTLDDMGGGGMIDTLYDEEGRNVYFCTKELNAPKADLVLSGQQACLPMEMWLRVSEIDPETGNDREIGYAVEKVLVPFEE